MGYRACVLNDRRVNRKRGACGVGQIFGLYDGTGLRAAKRLAHIGNANVKADSVGKGVSDGTIGVVRKVYVKIFGAVRNVKISVAVIGRALVDSRKEVGVKSRVVSYSNRHRRFKKMLFFKAVVKPRNVFVCLYVSFQVQRRLGPNLQDRSVYRARAVLHIVDDVVVMSFSGLAQGIVVDLANHRLDLREVNRRLVGELDDAALLLQNLKGIVNPVAAL